MSEPMTIVPEQIATPIVTPTDNKLSFKPEDYKADLAKLAKEMGVNIEPTNKAEVTPVAPTMPVQPETATVTSEATKPEVVVPEKFKTPDGSLDTEKLNKSMTNVDEALATYLAKEKELKRKINEVKAQENAYLNPTVTTPVVPTNTTPINTDFAKQLEADLANPDIGAGKVLARLFTAAQESVREQVDKEINGLKNVNAENTTRQQIESIGKTDPWVYTPEGMATLTKVLEEQPYLWQAPDPYKAAYMQYNGIKSVVSRSNPQVLTATPTARPSAPVLTGQAASQTPSSPEVLFDKLTPSQKLEFIDKVPKSEQLKWLSRHHGL